MHWPLYDRLTGILRAEVRRLSAAGLRLDVLAGLLSGRFGSVQVVRYWSNQSGPGQRLGERLDLSNTFELVARDAQPDA